MCSRLSFFSDAFISASRSRGNLRFPLFSYQVHYDKLSGPRPDDIISCALSRHVNIHIFMQTEGCTLLSHPISQQCCTCSPLYTRSAHNVTHIRCAAHRLLIRRAVKRQLVCLTSATSVLEPSVFLTATFCPHTRQFFPAQSRRSKCFLYPLEQTFATRSACRAT